MPARSLASQANIRLRVNPRNFRQRKRPGSGRTGVEESSSNRCISARSACQPGSETIRDYAIIVRLTEGIGPLKAAYGMWQDAQASFLLGEMFLSKFISLPSISTAATPVF